VRSNSKMIAFLFGALLLGASAASALPISGQVVGAAAGATSAIESVRGLPHSHCWRDPHNHRHCPPHSPSTTRGGRVH
jgi:hypothetical protein